MKNNLIFKVITNNRVKINIVKNVATFNVSRAFVKCPKKIGTKIQGLLKQRKYNLIKSLIDIYEDLFVTNLQ